MTIIQVKTADQVLTAVLVPKLAPHNQNSVKLTVDFDSAWAGYGKSAVFYTKSNPTPFEKVMDANDACLVPPEVLAEPGYLFITIKGVKTSDNSVKASARLKLKVSEGMPLFVVSDPTESVYNQLLAAYGDTGRAVAVERARLDEVLNGAAVADDEVADIRIDARGAIHESAGGAVRSQYNRILNRLTDITEPSINLFDKRQIEIGRFLSYDNTGETYDIDGFFVSDYIEVEPNTVYAISQTSSAKIISQYDATLTHITSASAWSVTTEANAKYIRFSHSVDYIDEMMLCKTVVPAVYTPYCEMIKSDNFLQNSIDGSKIKNNTIELSKISNYRVTSHNLFDKSAIIEGVYLYYGNGELKEFAGYFTTEYIAIKPNTVYSSSYIEQVAFYDENGKFIQKLTAVESGFTTPERAAFVRMSDDMGQLDTMQFNEGDTLLPYDVFSFTIDKLKAGSYYRRYTLGNAWNRWASGEKFPIGILGDSTTDGASTTGWTAETGHEYLDNQNGGFGSYDYINKNAYPYKLEQLIRAELNNTQMRVYNIGYSGYSFYSIMEHYDDIFSGVYSDVKMVGINMGINDRIPSGSPDKYYDDFRNHLIETIEYLYSKGIQPFIITSQATIEPYPDDSLGAFYPLRTSENINSIANRVKKEVAREYGLELLDMTMYDEFMMTYSDHKITDIITDDLHYKDLGHTLEAEFLFSEIAPRTIKVSDWANLDFASQRIKSECPSNKVTYMSADIARMKLMVDYTKDDTKDIVMQDFIINITSKDALTLKAYCTSANKQYVEVDGEVINITADRQTIKTLGVGIHRIKAMSGASTTVNWVGFRLE